jgi:hypothetical protein
VLEALKVNGHGTLACGACGAPLAAQKSRKVGPGEAPRAAPPAAKPRKVEKPRDAKRSHGVAALEQPGKKSRKKTDKYAKYGKKKKRKGLWSRIFEEAVDTIEDIFD